MLLLTLRGTPTCYYGDELAMVNVEVPPEMAHDPQELGKPGLGLGRDPERSPMQWERGPNAGFTTGQPWLPIAPDYTQYNVAVERDDPASMLTLVRALLALRRASPALNVGRYRAVPTATPDVFAYLREHAGQRMLVVLNFSHEPRTVALPADAAPAEIVLSTVPGRGGHADGATLALAADEGLILRVAG
jgi:alpha-glucosidase